MTEIFLRNVFKMLRMVLNANEFHFSRVDECLVFLDEFDRKLPRDLFHLGPFFSHVFVYVFLDVLVD